MQTTTGQPSGAARLLAPAAEVVAEASEWGIGPRLALTAFLAPFAGAAAVGAARGNRALFDFLTREDSLLEWLQFAGYATAAVLALVLAARLRSAAEPWAARACLVFAAANVFVAGEEISWGQRILGLETPEALDRINHQGETNIHNIPVIQRLFNIGELLAGLYGFAIPILWWIPSIRARLEGRLDRLLVPPLALATLFFLPFAYRAFRAVFLPEAGERVTQYGELPELALYLGALITGVAILGVLRRRATGVA